MASTKAGLFLDKNHENIMAQLLLLAKDIPNANRVIGDIVSEVPDSHNFSEEEDKRRWISNGNLVKDFPGLYMIVNVSGIPKATVDRVYEKHIRKATVLEPEFNAPDEVDRIIELGPARWHFDINQLSLVQRTELLETGYVAITYTKALINNLVTDRQGDDVFDTDTPIRKSIFVARNLNG